MDRGDEVRTAPSRTMNGTRLTTDQRLNPPKIDLCSLAKSTKNSAGFSLAKSTKENEEIVWLNPPRNRKVPKEQREILSKVFYKRKVISFQMTKKKSIYRERKEEGERSHDL